MSICYQCEKDVPYLFADCRGSCCTRLDGLEAALSAEKRAQEALAIRAIGQERYDASPCQAHPLELVEIQLEHLREVVATLDQDIADIIDYLVVKGD